jgi:hypothetical protein
VTRDASPSRRTGTRAAEALDDAIQTVGTSSGIDVGGTGSQTLHDHAAAPRVIAPVRKYADVVVGVVDDAARAEQALVTFRRKGFDGDQIGLVTCGGGLMVQLNALARADAADRGLGTALCELGVPEPEARQYEREFELGRSIVTVKAAGRARYAATVLQRAAQPSRPEAP